MPLKAAGILILPARSEPNAIGIHFDETNPASPPLLPPQDLDWSYIFLAVPQIKFVVWIVRAPYDTFPLTKGIAPASNKGTIAGLSFNEF